MPLVFSAASAALQFHVDSRTGLKPQRHRDLGAAGPQTNHLERIWTDRNMEDRKITHFSVLHVFVCRHGGLRQNSDVAENLRATHRFQLFALPRWVIAKLERLKMDSKRDVIS